MADRQLQALELYDRHRPVIRKVLSATSNRWRLTDGLELVNDFLVDHLPKALCSVESTPSEAWLYVVFRNFVFEKLRKEAIYKKHLRKLQASAVQLDIETHAECQDIEKAIENVRKAVLDRFVNLFHKGNISSLSLLLQTSRYKARQALLESVYQMVHELAAIQLIPRCSPELVDRLLLKQQPRRLVAESLGMSPEDVESTMEDVFSVLIRVLMSKKALP